MRDEEDRREDHQMMRREVAHKMVVKMEFNTLF
jgi:hypothetical protein